MTRHLEQHRDGLKRDRAFVALAEGLALDVVEETAASARLKGIVYTAFDGDDFYFTDALSSHVFERGWLPMNPESCLGYKPAVDFLHTKKRVLQADVALLDKADELWIYTRQDAAAPKWSDFAEGIIAELLYFLAARHGKRAPVAFVDIASIASSMDAEPVYVDVDAIQVRAELARTHADIFEFVDWLLDDENKIEVAVAAYHLADSKNGHWIRDWLIKRGYAPIVPTVAFSSASVRSLRDLADAWVLVARRADKMVRFVPSSGGSNAFVAVLNDCVDESKVINGDWAEVGAPKAVQREAWPITSIEKESAREVKTRSGRRVAKDVVA